MKKITWFAIFVSFFLANLACAAEPGKFTKGSVEIRAYQQEEVFILISARMIKGAGVYRINGAIYEGKRYYGQVISNEGKILAYFPSEAPSGIIFWDEFGSEIRGGTKIFNGKALIRAPYFPDVERIELLDPQGKKLLVIPMSEVTK